MSTISNRNKKLLEAVDAADEANGGAGRSTILDTMAGAAQTASENATALGVPQRRSPKMADATRRILHGQAAPEEDALKPTGLRRTRRVV